MTYRMAKRPCLRRGNPRHVGNRMFLPAHGPTANVTTSQGAEARSPSTWLCPLQKPETRKPLVPSHDGSL